MKKSLVAAAALLTALNTFGQGQGAVNFNSVGSGNYLRGPDGALCAGTAWRVALYWGAAYETDDRNLIQTGNSAAMLTGANAGYFNNFGRTITYTSPAHYGAVLSFQVRFWCSGGGTILSWDQAISAGVPTGKSRVFDVDTADPYNPDEIKPDIGFAPGFAGGFQIVGGLPCVPEPATISLCVLGAAALFLLRPCK